MSDWISRLEAVNQVDPLSQSQQAALSDARAVMAYHGKYGSSFDLNESNWLDNLKLRASAGNTAALDNLFQWYMSEQSAKTAREYETEKNANAIPTLVEGLKKAGINPYWLDSYGSAPTYTASSSKYSSGFEASRRDSESERNNKTNNILKILGTTLSAIAMMAMLA